MKVPTSVHILDVVKRQGKFSLSPTHARAHPRFNGIQTDTEPFSGHVTTVWVRLYIETLLMEISVALNR